MLLGLFIEVIELYKAGLFLIELFSFGMVVIEEILPFLSDALLVPKILSTVPLEKKGLTRSIVISGPPVLLVALKF